ncbi:MULTISPECIES: NADH:flavin oxidoreductase/NADH oxidase [Rhizobium]|uniref:2,4-dienoyl-CoA reductase-like NADH-dependent reductase (Old Yellow Enzyme family) n=1 Tax=Rhizobium fabae TaxID=573179 RepID=A0A7W6FIP0_9HYPH|nr:MULTISPECIES: NADH:flavin oxidoreductase/NADH oxidase [Rhizobium]MBB3914586.1 2,4-dienoyl-CoA reductase-like NADH-dependent reductase (Old Yellow Enzyme family) [Rhizobium fabae]PDS66209.1 NADH:flavin oxidoreductase / NADH oxidase [Rhizobium anhuiense]RUM14503.1 NADH:flavin oxidoreductase/NADH oxidase [Rhizobium fabae]
MSSLFQPLAIRQVSLKNRLALSPMCQYEAIDGFVTPYHLVHYGKFALGGFGLIMIEATAVSPEGRITHGDVGLWDDRQVSGLAEIAAFVKKQGATPGIQIAHAGPKAAMQRPYYGDGPLTPADHARGDHPWPIVSASAVPVDTGWLVPAELDLKGIQKVKDDFDAAARRALKSGFEVLELHAAHGYLLNSFLSPLTNERTDEYGGTLEGRMRLPLEIAKSFRGIWPQDKPLFVRISAVDGSRNGVTLEDSAAFAKELAAIGVDAIDCSSGGIGRPYEHPSGYGHQVPYAARIKAESELSTMAVGLIVDPFQAEEIVASGQADLVAIGREALREPNFALHAEQALDAVDPASPFANWPRQIGWWLNHRERKLHQLGAYTPRSSVAA